MSQSSSTLRVVSDDPTATITVLDGSQKIVAQQSGSLQQQLDNGIYKLKVRVGPELKERLVALDQDLPVQMFVAPKIASPIPVDGTAQSHEYHQMAVQHAWNNPVAALAAGLATGSRLLISVREWSPDQSRGHPGPAAALALILPSGERREFASFAAVNPHGDAYAIGCLAVDPGLYQIELSYADGGRHCRALDVSPGWGTQLFMLFHDIEGERLPNLADGSVVIARAPVTQDQQTRLAEIALDALTQHRSLLPGYLQDLLQGKFEQPLLGIIGAHLLLRDGLTGGAFKMAFDNVARMLGADHPDVVALATKLAPAKPKSVSRPPMLRASWDLLVEASGTVPDVIAPGSLAAKIAERVLPSVAWLTWQAVAGRDEVGGYDAKLEVVRAFVQAQGEIRGTAPAAENEAALARDVQPRADLNEQARADLRNALGVPQITLDTLLARL